MPELTDWDNDFCGLMQRVGEGSEDAAWELVDQYGEAIRRAVRRMLNERLRSKFDSLDFVQIVWNSLFRVRDKLDQFDRPEELTAYLVTMARNKVGMEVRRRLMTEKYNVKHEESLEQLQATGRRGHSQPAACAHRRGHRPRAMGPLARRSAAALSPKSSSCGCRGTPTRASPTPSIWTRCTVRRFLKRLLHTVPHDRGNLHDPARFDRQGSATRSGLLDANRLVDAVKRRWRQGERPDVKRRAGKPPGTAALPVRRSRPGLRRVPHAGAGGRADRRRDVCPAVPLPGEVAVPVDRGPRSALPRPRTSTLAGERLVARGRQPLPAVRLDRRDRPRGVWPGVSGHRAGLGRPAGRREGGPARRRRGRDDRPAAASQHRSDLLPPGGRGHRTGGFLYAVPGPRDAVRRAGPVVPCGTSPASGAGDSGGRRGRKLRPRLSGVAVSRPASSAEVPTSTA